MISTQNGETPHRLLRVWPGIVLVVLQWTARFGIKAVIPGIEGFSLSMMVSFVFTILLIVWWTFFSRVKWRERLGGLAFVALALGVTWLLRHESMWIAWLLAYAVPFLSLALVLWAVLTRRLPDRLRHATMAATILIACGAWLLVRQDGINGDHKAAFGFRWSASAEERLLAETQAEQTNAPSVATTSAAPSPSPSASGLPTASPSPTLDPTKTAQVAPAWPGFRGADRNGVVHHTQIKIDWSTSPPVQIWRRPVGPGWSSFAVDRDLFYTQEQRGENEVVACYKMSTGEPVWSHRDGVRFFESNAGAGPRATPTLANGRLYTLGATGILNVLDAKTGAVVWTRNVAAETSTQTPVWGFSGSPLVMDGLVIVAASGQLVAYDAATGNRRWVGPNAGGSYSSPQAVAIGGVIQVLLMSGSGVTSISPADGKQLWQHTWPGNSIVQPALNNDGDLLITSQEYGARRLALTHNGNGWTATERWTSNALKPYFNDFVIHNGHAFGFDGRILSCIDLKDGQRKWKGGRYGNGQLVLLADQDLLLVLSEEGEMVLVRATPDQFTEIAKLPAIQGKTWNHPVLVRDVLLVRNSEEMAAFRLPVASN